MADRNEIVDEKIFNFLNALKKRYRIHSVYIYGSYSKGNATEWSDIDLAVVSPDFSENTFDARVELMKISATIDDRIEPHPFRIEDFKSSNPLVNEIQKHGIQIS